MNPSIFLILQCPEQKKGLRLLGIEIEANRIPIKLSEGDVLIVFQLLERLPEGKVLSEEELKKLKYKFYKVEILV